MKLYDLGQYIIISPDIVRWHYYMPYAERRERLLRTQNAKNKSLTYRNFQHQILGGIVGCLACSKGYGLFTDTDILKMCKGADATMEKFRSSHDANVFGSLIEMYRDIAIAVDAMEDAAWNDDGAKGAMEKIYDESRDQLSVTERVQLKHRIKTRDEDTTAENLSRACHIIAGEARDKYVKNTDVRLTRPYEKLIREVAGDKLSPDAVDDLQAILGIPLPATEWFEHKAMRRRERCDHFASIGMPAIIMAYEQRQIDEAEAFHRAAKTRLEQAKAKKADDDGARRIVETLVADLCASKEKCEKKVTAIKEKERMCKD